MQHNNITILALLNLFYQNRRVVFFFCPACVKLATHCHSFALFSSKCRIIFRFWNMQTSARMSKETKGAATLNRTLQNGFAHFNLPLLSCRTSPTSSFCWCSIFHWSCNIKCSPVMICSNASLPAKLLLFTMHQGTIRTSGVTKAGSS